MNLLLILNNIFSGWVSEYKFCDTRKWRADYCHPDKKIIIEIEGAVWVQGRHTRGSGYIKDMEKYNEAQKLGYIVLRYTPQQISNLIDDVKFLKNRSLTK